MGNNILLLTSFLLSLIIALKKGYLDSGLLVAVLLIGIILLVVRNHLGVTKIFIFFVTFIYFIYEFDMYSVDGAIQAFTMLIPVMIVVYGLYIIINGLFGKNKKDN